MRRTPHGPSVMTHGSIIGAVCFVALLAMRPAAAEGELFLNNLLNKPFFIVNGGADPLYPTRVVERSVENLKEVKIGGRLRASGSPSRVRAPHVREASFRRGIPAGEPPNE